MKNMKWIEELFENSQWAHGYKVHDTTIVGAGNTQFAYVVAWLPQNQVILRKKGE